MNVYVYILKNVQKIIYPKNLSIGMYGLRYILDNTECIIELFCYDNILKLYFVEP